jgi:hypothetical protein
VMRDRGFVRSLIERAVDAGCTALVVTLDLQVVGQRHKDIRNGLSTPPRIDLRSVAQLVARPRWCLGMLTTRHHRLGNIVGHAPGAKDLRSMSEWVAGQFDLEFSWSDIAWLRGLWPGQLILKGILDAEDARIAAETGADAIVVSNHGGRQLDGAPSSISKLPQVVEAGRERDRGSRRWRHPLWSERVPRPGARGTWPPYRSGLYLRAGGDGAGGRDPSTRHPGQRAGRHYGTMRRTADRRYWPAQSRNSCRLNRRSAQWPRFSRVTRRPS